VIYTLQQSADLISKRQQQVKRTKINPGMPCTVQLVSSVLPLTATTDFLLDRTGSLNQK